MKSNILILIFSFALILSTEIHSQKVATKESNVGIQLFYKELNAYGQWVNYEQLGYAWIPNVGSDFIPYATHGRWILTDLGWTWVSDFTWGWAPFHYGRWIFDHYYGWIWIPGNVWAPSWVIWRETGDFYGWTPMKPSLPQTSHLKHKKQNRKEHWMIVKTKDLEKSNIDRFLNDESIQVAFVKNSKMIKNSYFDNSRHTTYNSGPRRLQVQEVMDKMIKPMDILDIMIPGEKVIGDSLHIFRPQLIRSTHKSNRISTIPLTKLNDVKPYLTR